MFYDYAHCLMIERRRRNRKTTCRPAVFASGKQEIKNGIKLHIDLQLSFFAAGNRPPSTHLTNSWPRRTHSYSPRSIQPTSAMERAPSEGLTEKRASSTMYRLILGGRIISKGRMEGLYRVTLVVTWSPTSVG